LLEAMLFKVVELTVFAVIFCTSYCIAMGATTVLQDVRVRCWRMLIGMV